jgi:hypothetical protein
MTVVSIAQWRQNGSGEINLGPKAFKYPATLKHLKNLRNVFKRMLKLLTFYKWIYFKYSLLLNTVVIKLIQQICVQFCNARKNIPTEDTRHITPVIIYVANTNALPLLHPLTTIPPCLVMCACNSETLQNLRRLNILL